MSESVRERVLSLLRPFFDDTDDQLLARDPNNLGDDFARRNLEDAIATPILSSDASIAALIERLEANPVLSARSRSRTKRKQRGR